MRQQPFRRYMGCMYACVPPHAHTAVAEMNSRGASCSSGGKTTHRRHSFRTNLGFSLLFKDALACGLQVAGVKPVTFETPYRRNGGKVKVWLDLLVNKIRNGDNSAEEFRHICPRLSLVLKVLFICSRLRFLHGTDYLDCNRSLMNKLELNHQSGLKS